MIRCDGCLNPCTDINYTASIEISYGFFQVGEIHTFYFSDGDKRRIKLSKVNASSPS
jgi:hypothetical protein